MQKIILPTGHVPTREHLPKPRRAVQALMVCLFMQIAVFETAPAAPDQSSSMAAYLRLRHAGLYHETLALLREWTLGLDSPATIETNLFRIRELLSCRDLAPAGLDALTAIRASSLRHPFVRDRADIIINSIYLAMGDLAASKALMDGLAYRGFHAMGPFTSRTAAEFHEPRSPEQGFIPGQTCRNGFLPVSWFDVSPDRTGAVDLGALYSDMRNSHFYLHNEFTVPEAGDYYLIMGKTGRTVLWLDGSRVWTDDREHRFMNDQYFARVTLTPGRHEILLKLGDFRGSITVSLRIASADGRRIAGFPAASGAVRPGRLSNVTYFPALAAALGAGDDTHRLFDAGYLLLEAGLDTEAGRTEERLARIPDSNYLFPLACYLRARAARSPDVKERLLRRSVTVRPANIESLLALSELKTSLGFLDEAYLVIDAIRSIDPRSPWHRDAMGRLFLKRGWTVDTLLLAHALASSPYPSRGALLEAEALLADGNIPHAIDHLERCLAADGSDLDLRLRLASCYRRSGRIDAEERLLHQAIALHVNSTGLMLRLAETVAIRRGNAAAIPYCAAALKAAPENPAALRALGMAYHAIGARQIALDYLSRALRRAPDDNELERYLSFLTEGKDDLSRHAIAIEQVQLAAEADRFPREPAVILLDETVISVRKDGSYERMKRDIVRVNDHVEARKRRAPRITYDPLVESVADVYCVVIRNGARREVTGRRRTPPAVAEGGPAARLESIVIPVPDLAPGDIIELRHTVSNRGTDEDNGHFGARVQAGDHRRTVLFHAALVHPASEPIYPHLKGIPSSAMTVKRSAGRIVCDITLRSIPPVRHEAAMPPLSQILPAVLFTTHRSWAELAARYRALIRDRGLLSEDAKNALRAVIGAGDSPLERVKKIHSHVVSSIRYLDVEPGPDGPLPRRIADTLLTGAGNRGDIALLLTSMLREAGINARLALLRTADRGAGRPAVPFAGEFNRVLCHVDLEGGFFLDPAAGDAGFGEITGCDRDAEALVITDAGFRFVRAGGAFCRDSLEEVKTDITIADDGGARITRTAVVRGPAAAALRRKLRRPDGLRAELTTQWSGIIPGSSISDLTTGVLHPDEPIRYGYIVTAPSFARRDGGVMTFRAVPDPSGLHRRYARTARRLYPLILPDTLTSQHTITFRLPPGYRIGRMPDNERMDRRAFSAEFSYSAGAAFSVRSAIALKRRRLEADEYRVFREFTRFLDRKELEQIVFEK